jgi:hypothetical protein
MTMVAPRLSRGLLVAFGVLAPALGAAEGLLYQLPKDGSWVRFDLQYSYKSPTLELAGTGTLYMASVGQVVEGSEECRWIEFDVRLKDSEGEHRLIRKLLIPTRYLKKGVNPTEHVIRGWAKFDNEDVEAAVPVHGRWPAYLAGPLQDEKVLDRQPVSSKLGSLVCDGVSGWIQFREGKINTKVTFETRLHKDAPFGVVSTRMFFEVTSDSPPYTIDSTATLVEVGGGAQSILAGNR